MKENKKAFNYTFSASEQKEIEAIRKKYINQSPNDDKMEQLRKLDSRVTKKAQIVSLTVGIVSALVMGIGMSLVMTDIGFRFEIDHSVFLGILIGFAGIIGVIAAYPLYRCVLKKERNKEAPRILALVSELACK